MISAKALKPLLNNEIIIGYTLKDETGKEMDIRSEAIIDAMTKNLINITNLKITDDNKLVMITNEVNNTEQNKVNTYSKEQDNKEANIDKEKLNRMHYLVNTLNDARKVYEQGTDEIMSNYEYDKLYDELVNIELETGTVLENSPTANVGYEVVSKLPKEKHETPMLSLDKTKDRESLVSWLNGKEGMLSWKMDGLTVVLTYQDGRLVKGVTRGNGEIGEVVTPNVKQFKNVPRHIAFKNKLVLRGEAVITYSSFNKINNAITLNEEKYKNPRNLCSGSVRQLDSSITAQRDVMWYAFEVVEADGANFGNDFEKQLQWLKIQGFDTVEYEIVTPGTILGAIERFSNKVKTNDVPTDGLVLTYKDREYGRSLGRTAKFPRHSIAFKWQDETAETSLIDIEWQVGRTGIITPVAIFEPVDLEGSTVSRASLHNLSVMYDTLGQPYVGQKIRVYKANMIIPQIISGDKLEDE